MIKFLFPFFIFFSLLGSFSATARNEQDTTVVLSRDTTIASEVDSVSAADASEDSLYMPVPDSLFSPPGSIREVSGKLVNRYKNNPEYAYANDSEYWRKEPLHEPGLLFRILSSQAFRWVFLTLIAGLILYGVYQLAIENNFTLLIRTRKQKMEYAEPGLPEEKMNFDEVIRFNQTEGNYRMAVRFLYLRLIYILKEKSGISFRDSSTNVEIARAMGDRPEATAFRWLATAYEYVFYGGFIPDQETYYLIKNKFEALQKIFLD
ncbi:MAG TPA: DUF4129 domain-containing protein [Puia sp.]